ncbi:MAG: CsgG/HfaB family protein [Flavobacterium sp.]
MKYLKRTYLLLFILLTSCQAYLNQPVGIQKATFGQNTSATINLKNLPPPKEPVVVGVYKFKDQTGQYKPTENGSSFSTAVTQGATSILINALEDSKWFTPIERENLGNLLNERNIIRSTREEFNPNAKQTLTPLLFAGVLLEGGIISYDSNVLTGGFGARYFGTGGSVRYKQDRVTVYLRLVSTSNGKILNTVYVSKTILSQSVDANLFKYVNIKRLLEVETGFTRNEPMQLAVTEAIEKAVESIIIEGLKDNLWESKAPKKVVDDLITTFENQKIVAEDELLYAKEKNRKRGRIGLEASGGVALIDGDYANPVVKPMGRGAVKFFFTPHLSFSASGNVFKLGNKNKLDVGYATLDANIEFMALPYNFVSPFFYGGTGTGFNSKFENVHQKIQFGAGLEYLFTNNFGVKLFGEYNMTFTDNLDFVKSGIRDDYYWRFGIGMTYYFPTKLKVSKQ